MTEQDEAAHDPPMEVYHVHEEAHLPMDVTEPELNVPVDRAEEPRYLVSGFRCPACGTGIVIRYPATLDPSAR